MEMLDLSKMGNLRLVAFAPGRQEGQKERQEAVGFKGRGEAGAKCTTGLRQFLVL